MPKQGTPGRTKDQTPTETGWQTKPGRPMPLDNYGFSRKFARLSDRYGVSWQLNLPNE